MGEHHVLTDLNVSVSEYNAKIEQNIANGIRGEQNVKNTNVLPYRMSYECTSSVWFY